MSDLKCPVLLMVETAIGNTEALQIACEQELWLELGLRLGLGLGFRVRISVSYVTWSYISHLIAEISLNTQA